MSRYKPGDRVRVTSLQARGFTGTVVDAGTLLDRECVNVHLDSPSFGHDEVTVTWRELEPVEPPAWLVPGQRVTFANRLLRRRTGTLIRPSRLLWKKAWLVDIDGLPRTRVVERALMPLESEPPPVC